MACASFTKLNASSSQWIGQQSFNQRPASSSRLPVRRVSVVRAGSYSEELVKTAVSFSTSDFIFDWFPYFFFENFEFRCFVYVIIGGSDHRMLLLVLVDLGFHFIATELNSFNHCSVDLLVS